MEMTASDDGENLDRVFLQPENFQPLLRSQGQDSDSTHTRADGPNKMHMNRNEKEKLRIKAEVFKALGSPVRLAILEYLRPSERCVCEITEHIGTDVSNVSKHLSILLQQGLVTNRREGLKIFYRFVMPCTVDFTKCVEGLIHNRLERQRNAMKA